MKCIELSMASSRVALYSSLVLVIMMFTLSEAKDFLVGGSSNAWVIPSSQSEQPLNKWAQSSRFQIGDSLVRKYEAEKDSVLEVTRENYMSCNITSPVAEYKDGNTKVTLERSGAYYFISGAKGHCEKGQKLIIVVMSQKHISSIAAAPAFSPMGAEGPSVAKTSNANGLKSGLMMVMTVTLLGLALA